MSAFEVHSWPALPFIVPVVSPLMFTGMGRTPKDTHGFVAVTVIAFFSSLTLMKPASQALKKWLSMVPGFATQPGH